MSSPKPYDFVSEESSDVKMLDSNEPLVPTARVQVLEANDPLMLPCVSSVFEEPVAGPSGVPAGSSNILPAIASSSADVDEDVVPAIPGPTESTGKRMNLSSDEIRSMWNWRKVFSKLGTNDQCVQFAEDRGLIPRAKLCSYHRSPMSLTKESGQVGKFWCRKKNCRTRPVSRAIGTWFENARLPLTVIFQIMYAFSEGLTYHQTQKELTCDDGPVVSPRTVAHWFSECRETVRIYGLESQRVQGTIKHLDPFEELINAIKDAYKFD